MASTSTQGASSSSTPAPQWRFDVFLSFRGEDTRKGFTDHLYAALKRKEIMTFRDDEKLDRGKPISQELLKAIEESRLAIVIFSENYASSTWCLDELTKIVRCMKEMGMTVYPVFYDVDPSDVRKQNGTYKKAFAEHEECFKENIEKVKTWREALKEVANICGWHLQDRPEAEFIQEIVEMILHKLSPSFSSITKGLVGIDSLVEKLIPSYLGFGNNVYMIGICGMGGLGKTTLARVVYEEFCSRFEGSSFIANVREESKKHGLTRLQRQLLVQILGDWNKEIWNDDDGVNMIKKMLCHKKVLIVLDDVDKLNQLEKLVGEHDWFGKGSWIIITTRDEHLLVQHAVHKIYKPSALCSHDAQKLFCLKAFQNEPPREGYMQLSMDVVDYANGLPLALVVLGSFLVGRTMDEWQSALDKLKKIPKGDIFDKLKVSYDGLDEMDREIFLDIACFFRGWRKDRVIEILENCDFNAIIGISVLIEKSLITIENEELQMHDLLQEMGREIVHRESHGELGKRSRLYLCEDLFHVLTNDTATEAIQAIVLIKSYGEGGCWNFGAFPKPFSKMCNLRLLIIEVVHILPRGVDHVSKDSRSREFPFSRVFSDFDDNVDDNLRFLGSYIDRVFRDDYVYDDSLESCFHRVFGSDYYVHNDIRFLEFGLDHVSKLRFLQWKWYSSKCLPPGFQPNELVELNLQYSQIEYLWEGVKYLDKLKCIDLTRCSNLVRTPEFIGVPRLERIYLCECINLVEIHPSIGQLSELKVLDLRGCGRLQSLPKLPSTVRYINAERCNSLELSPTLLETGILSDPCSQWCRYGESNCGEAFTILNRYLQGRLSPKAGHETCTKRKEDGSGAEFQIIYPALPHKVPQWPWLTHQSIGSSISIELPPNWCNSRWMGLALCACLDMTKLVFRPFRVTVDLIAHETALGDMPHSHYTCEISSQATFDRCHIWLLYLSRDTWFATVRNGECSQIRISFKIYEYCISFIENDSVVLNCGARLVYEQDLEEFNQTIAQCESSHKKRRLSENL